MNKEKKVTSQPLAKKIHDKAKEKGFELPESEYYWNISLDTGSSFKPFLKNVPLESGNFMDEAQYRSFNAYDIAELGEILKKAFDNLSGTMINDPRGHFKRLWQRTTGFKDEAEARGNLYFYLLKNDLL